ncbi:MAG: SgcJ/EcaC family oxidoreductase [Planctomycetales bacterium]|nr:SgcJ/EcaC family oxidoreductase [Planctomycetales bacterium]
MSRLGVATALAMVLAGPHVCGAHSDEDRAAISQAVTSYVEAFNAADAAKLAALWSPEGIYTSRTSGEEIQGREALEEEFEAIFADGEPRELKVATESIEFVSPNVALERGTAIVSGPGDATSETRYRVIYVRRDGQWLIDRVTEDEVVPQVSHYEQLKELEWLIGKWVDEGDGITIETECKWTENQNYLYQLYKISTLDGQEFSGLQIIGWDADQKQIRSWLFDSDGGFVSGTWQKRDDRWVVQAVATLADGGRGSFTSIFRPLGEGRYAWQKVNRVVDGQLLPNMDEVVVTRK